MCRNEYTHIELEAGFSPSVVLGPATCLESRVKWQRKCCHLLPFLGTALAAIFGVLLLCCSIPSNKDLGEHELGSPHYLIAKALRVLNFHSHQKIVVRGRLDGSVG